MRTGTVQARATRPRRHRFEIKSPPTPAISIQAIGAPGKRGSGNDISVALEAAVVFTDTVTFCAPLPKFTEELERAQVGAGLAAGTIAQARFTVPLKDPMAAKARVNDAVCPALMVCEVEAPEAGPTEKSGATVNTTAVLWTLVPELPKIVTA
jgi:hypothetical protein